MSTQTETVTSGGGQPFWLHAGRETKNKNIFFVGVILAASGLVSPPMRFSGG